MTFEVSGKACNLKLSWTAGIAKVETETKEEKVDPSCSAHPGCAALLGLCCPTSAGDALDCCFQDTRQTYHGHTFKIIGKDGNSWRLYTLPHNATLSLHDDQIRITYHQGILRLAYLPDKISQQLLDTHAQVIPISGKVTALSDSEYILSWQTYQNSNNMLLMLALPHHAAALRLGKQNLTAWQCIKGRMSAVIGTEWHLHVPKLPSAKFHYASASRDPATVELVVHTDIDALSTIDEVALARTAGIYSSGKRATRLAGLALAADAVHSHDAARTAALAAARAVSPWLDPKTKLLAFDLTYGGICTLAGLQDVNADFGNGNYNDHHYHYGYLLYASAIVLNILGPDRGFKALAGKDESVPISHKEIHRVQAALAALIADIAAPFSAESWWINLFPSKIFPPVARHKDFYDGHSYASGLFPMEDGKSQESVSEAAHCYYAVALLASVLNDNALQEWAMLLAATEIHAARFYWHIHDTATDIYPEQFTDANSIVAVVGAGDLSAHVWFGANPAFAHLVNALPFTPLTEHLLLAPYVFRAVEQVGKALNSKTNELATWRSLDIQLAAIVDPDAAMHTVLSLAFTDDDQLRNAPPLDTTQSLGSLLYWVTTRPYDPPVAQNEKMYHGGLSSNMWAHHEKKNMTTKVQYNYASTSSCAEHPKCRNLGMTGDCCPTKAGVQLWCCV